MKSAGRVIVPCFRPEESVRKPETPALHRRGFTLVELLVVIGIIAVLISILFPAFSRVREQGRRVNCLSNLRQIALALQVYADDNVGRYPAPAWIGDPLPDDWIYWQKDRDLTQGETERPLPVSFS